MGCQASDSAGSTGPLSAFATRDGFCAGPRPQLAVLRRLPWFQRGFGPRFPDGGRFIAVAPPDGTARLALVTPQPDSEEYTCIGKSRQVVFLTEDVEGKYRQWSDRGVSFLHPPKEPAWGGVYTQFRDVDGNSFALMGFDQANREVEEQRRLTEERLESERRAAQELEIARQVQSRLFPQTMPPVQTLEYAGACIQARHVGGDYYDYLDLGRGRLGLVIADIAGKGIAAALLMANLQANLRSQCATVRISRRVSYDR
jgi:hypothetical protein